MKLLSVLSLSVVVACATPPDESSTAQAVWSNGDFESDAIGTAPTGWTRSTNLGQDITDTRPSVQTLASLNLTSGGTQMTLVVGGATESQADPDVGTGGTLRYPKYGQRAVRLNYLDSGSDGSGRNSNTITQTMTVTQGDVDPTDDKVHVRFALAPILENPGHAYIEQPYYFVRLVNNTQSTTLYSDFNASGQPGVPWKDFTDSSGEAAQYTDWQLVDISPGNAALAVGDQVTLTVIATGCSLGGHWGRVYLDAVGSGIPGLYTWGTGPQQANAGTNITYTLSYKNGGTTTTSGTTLDFVTPPNTTFQSVSAPGCTTPSVNGTGTVSCPLGTLGQGATGAFTVTVAVAAGTANGTVITNGNYTIYATGVSALVGPKVQTTVTSGVSYADAGITISDGIAALAWGQSTRYTMVASNTGPLAMTGTVTLPLPSNAASMSWTCDAGGTSCGAGAGAINEAVALAIGASQTYTVDITLATGSGSASSVATASISVAGGETDPDATDNTAVDTNSVGLLRTLTVTNTNAAQGTVVSSPSTVHCGATCTGDFLDGSAIVLTATPIAGATFVGWSGACSGTTTTCNVTMDAAKAATANFVGAPSAATSGGATQTTAVSTPFATPLSVTVRDAGGNGIPGLAVSFTANGTTANASLSAASAVTDATGTAQVTATANATPGAYTASATVPGLAAPITFSLRNVGTPTQLTLVSGTPQSTAVMTPYASLSVLVRDAANYPLPSITVGYARPGSGASITAAASATTDASGIASLGATANPVAGSFTVTASVGAMTVPFSLTNVAGPPAVIAIVAGDNQTQPITTPFGANLVARVTDAFGNPLAGRTVTFSGNVLDVVLSPSSATTAANGQASLAAPTAGTRAGSYQIAATDGALSTAFAATNLPGAPASIAVTAGNNQQAVVDAEFASDIEVLVRDIGSNPVPNATVTFTAPASIATATLSHASRQTGSDGKTTVRARAGQKIGSYRITAAITGGSAEAALENTHDVPSAIAVVAASSPQTTTVLQAFAQPLAVRVADRFDNPVSAATVSLEVPSSGATASVAATMTTDTDGLASASATASAIAGAYVVVARVGAVGPATFSLTNIAGSPAQLEIAGGATQSTIVDTAFAVPLRVRVRDANDNVVPNANVHYTAPTVGYSAVLSSNISVSDVDGLASVIATANTISGVYDVIATLDGAAAPVAFALTNRAAAPATLTIDAATTPQAARVSTPFVRALGVTIRDTFGNGVPQIAVSYAAPATGATAVFAQPTATTDETGKASVIATAGTTTGTYAVTASIAGGLSGAFALQNLQGEPATVAIVGGEQTTVVDTPFITPLVVEVRDEFANVVVGATVTFVAPSSPATALLSATTATTDAAGHAQVTARASTTAGGYTVFASTSNGAAPALFPLVNVADVPASIVAEPDASQQSTEIGHAFALPLAVTVFDAFGNRVPGIEVAYAAPSYFVTLSQATAQTDIYGRAWVHAVATTVAIAYTATASIGGLTATFGLENTAAGPGGIVLVSGGSQHARATAAFGEPVVAMVVDAFGNAVPDAEVTAALPETGASATIAAPLASTDADGLVRVQLVANGSVGDFTLVLRSRGALTPLRVPLAVDAIPTTTTATAGEISADEPLRIDVTVGAALGTAEGDVELLEGDVIVATATLAGGTATITTTAPQPGKRTYRVRYGAHGVFAASTSGSVTVEVADDRGSLSGGSGACNTSGGNASWLVVVFGAMLLLRRRRAVLVAAATAVAAAPALAEEPAAGSRAIDRMHSAAADSEWFAVDSLGFDGHRDVTVEVLNDYAYHPLVAYDGAGNERGVIVSHSYVMQVGASVSLARRFRLSATVPFSTYQTGNDTMFNGVMLRAPVFAFGDITIAGDVRMVGTAHGALRVAAGIRFALPTGSRTNYMSDGVFGIEPRLMVAGGAGRFEYAAVASLMLREQTELAHQSFGGELRASIGAGARFGKLLVGPELVAARSLETDMATGTPSEVALGASYQVHDAWRLGLGASLGLSNAVGVPDQRALLSVTWLRR